MNVQAQLELRPGQSTELLKELQRATVLPSFNEEVLRATVSEMLHLDGLIVQALTEAQNDPE